MHLADEVESGNELAFQCPAFEDGSVDRFYVTFALYINATHAPYPSEA